MNRFIVVFFLAFCAWLPLVASSSSAKEKNQEPYALLMGTCFNEKGFSLPGVTVTVEMKVEASQKTKRKKWEMLSSPRGEFSVRLPAGSNVFLVTASKKGFRPLEKTVKFEGEERQDIIFNMERESQPPP